MTAVSRRPLLAVCFALMASPITPAAQPVAFTVLTQGTHSGISTFSEVVVRSPDEWAALWLRHAAGTSTPTVPPAVDFSRNMVIAVFFGKVPEGQRTAILSVQKENNRLIVLLQIIGPPGPESEDLPQITPFHIVEVSRSSLPVIFMRAKIPEMYSPGH